MGELVLRHPRLPPEVIDAIIDFLHADRAALTTCALVCKSWVPATRNHLFSRITIFPWNRRDVSKLLSSMLCTIALAVRHLVLDAVEGPHDLDVITRKLPNIVKLSFRGSPALCTHILPLHALVHILRDLDILELEDVSLDEDDQLLALLHHSPRLRSISCNCVLLPDGDQTLQVLPNESGRLIPKLKSLRVDSSINLLSWFVARWASGIPRLTTLDICLHPLSPNDGSMQNLLEAVGPSLQVFRLSAHSGTLPPVTQYFTLLTQLHTLSFNCTGDVTSIVRFVSQAMSHLTSPHLKSLIITLPLGESTMLDFDTWSKLGSVLEDTRFLHVLNTLAFQPQNTLSLIDTGIAKVMKRWIKERFPLYVELGILDIETPSSSTA